MANAWLNLVRLQLVLDVIFNNDNTLKIKFSKFVGTFHSLKDCEHAKLVATWLEPRGSVEKRIEGVKN